MSIKNYRNEMLYIYNTRLNVLRKRKNDHCINMFDPQIKSLENIIYFINTASDKEVVKLPALLKKFRIKSYISNFELKFIQTKYYNYIKTNTRKKHLSYNRLMNESFLFGFIPEIKKGYNIVIKEKLYNENSIYKLDKEQELFLENLLEIGKKYKNIFKKTSKKLFARSVKHFGNAETVIINPNKRYVTPFHNDKDFRNVLDNNNPNRDKSNRKDFVEKIQDTGVLIFSHAKNEKGRIYNYLWNGITKVDKIGLFPNHESYDLNAGIYQFLNSVAIEKGLSNKHIKYYIENKSKLRASLSKEFFNSFVYKIQKGNSLNNIIVHKIPGELYTYIVNLYIEIEAIMDAMNYKEKNPFTKVKKYNKLFKAYETWERKVIKEFIEKNNIKSDEYITNHDEILVDKKVKIIFKPNMFGYESIEERQNYFNKMMDTSKQKFIEARDNLVKEKKRKERIIQIKGILKRTKNVQKRLMYQNKLISLEIGYDEEFIENKVVIPNKKLLNLI